MLRILKYMCKVKVGLSQIHPYAGFQKRSYPTDPSPPDEMTDKIPTKKPTEDVRQSLYTDGYHLLVDRVEVRGDTEGRFPVDEKPENIMKDEALEEEETQEIIEGFYTGEPLRLRVNHIQRDAEEIQMMESQMQQGKESKDDNKKLDDEASLEEMSAAARKWREQRSQRYFPKLKKPPRASTLNELKVETVIRSYWSRGHLAALIDPLYISRTPMFRPEFPSRTVLKQHRVPVDKDTLYHLLPGDATTLGGGCNRIKLDKLMKRLNSAYCSTIGVEFSYVHDPDTRCWIKDRMETIELRFMHREQQRYCMKKLIEIEAFSEFMKDKVPNKLMRYIPLGSETSLLAVDLLIERAVKKHNARVFAIGMRRLGRMNILANVLNVKLENIFSLVQSEIGKSVDGFCLGIENIAPSSFLKDVLKRMTLMSSCAIPENFFPLTLGFVRGMQIKQDDTNGEKVWPIIIHMAKGLNSQGIVFETLKLNQINNYETFGTIHIIFNNQMEQTLRRETHMITEYCTDTLKTVNIPIFHVNGDDVQAVHFVLRMAADFRSQFHRDVAVDIVSYSRFMPQRLAVKYEEIKVQQAIGQTEPIVLKYGQELIKEGSITQMEIDNWRKDINRVYTEAWNLSVKKKIKIDKDMWTSQLFLDKVQNLEMKYENVYPSTGVNLETLNKICKALYTAPKNVNLNPKHVGFLKRRRRLVEDNKLDWILCEAMAYGSLLVEGMFVRISGMDVNRRFHIIEEDADGGETYNLLNNIKLEQAKYYLCKSTTSQYATAAFEYGYSTSTLSTLVIWEAPEGDKTSKAQVVIDHYIAGGFLKFNYHSNMIILVPHYHRCENASKVCNGRPERFLQLVNNCETMTEMNVKTQLKETNMILANVSTPANLFHILRRQMYLPYRRPLVIFTPNLLVSHPDCKAQFSELTTGSKFQPYIPDDYSDIFAIKKLLICTGGIYYDLKAERKKRNLEGTIGICRIEQICPLPYAIMNADLMRYWVSQYVWVQEEPINQGWWTYIEPRLTNLPLIRRLECVARPARADGGSRSIPSCYDEYYSVIDKALQI